jgi:hypothetical protein
MPAVLLIQLIPAIISALEAAPALVHDAQLVIATLQQGKDPLPADKAAQLDAALEQAHAALRAAATDPGAGPAVA